MHEPRRQNFDEITVFEDIQPPPEHKPRVGLVPFPVTSRAARIDDSEMMKTADVSMVSTTSSASEDVESPATNNMTDEHVPSLKSRAPRPDEKLRSLTKGATQGIVNVGSTVGQGAMKGALRAGNTVGLDTGAITNEQVETMMQQYDTDGDGTFSREEVRAMVSVLGQEQKGRKLMGKVASLVCVLFMLMLVGNAGLTFAVVYLSRETRIADGATMVVADVGGSASRVIATAEATVAVPLYVAPVLPVEQLGAIRWLAAHYMEVTSYRYLDVRSPSSSTGVALGLNASGTASRTANGTVAGTAPMERVAVLTTVHTVFRITEVTTYSATHIDFFTEGGRYISIAAGDADLVDPATGTRRSLCVANVSCASFSVAAGLEEGLHEAALRALIQAGHAIPDEVRAIPIVESLLAGPLAVAMASESRRRLAHLSMFDQGDAPAYTFAACTDTCFSVAPSPPAHLSGRRWARWRNQDQAARNNGLYFGQANDGVCALLTLDL